ncbi:MAG: hypothetical protein ACR2OD_12510 [Gaiellaceae bacterium]
MSIAATDAPWPERRFSQAIAEGDGISLVPVLRGDVGSLAMAAESAGAEAVLVDSIPDVRAARVTTALPVVARLRSAVRAELEAARADGADAVALPVAALVTDARSAYAEALALGLDCAIRVSNEDELQLVLEVLEPEILVAALENGADPANRGLALLTDVPAGKLVIVEAEPQSRDDVVALERAGVDALVVEASSSPDELAATLRELIGAAHPLD